MHRSFSSVPASVMIGGGEHCKPGDRMIPYALHKSPRDHRAYSTGWLGDRDDQRQSPLVQARSEGRSRHHRWISGRRPRKKNAQQHSEASGTKAAEAVRYPVVIEKAGKNYSAYCPDLPGCVATGRTQAEVLRRLKKAVAPHIAGLKEDDLPVSGVCPGSGRRKWLIQNEYDLKSGPYGSLDGPFSA